MNTKPKKVKHGCWKRQSKKKTINESIEIPITIFKNLDTNIDYENYNNTYLKFRFINLNNGIYQVAITGKQTNETIKVITKNQFRGVKKYFVCTGCNNQTTKLYLDSQIRCRTCLGLTYLSSQIHNTKKELSIISSQLRGVIVQRL